MTVRNHHCPASAQHVVDVRKLYALGKAPSFDPPRPAAAPAPKAAREELDEIVHAFHASSECETANRTLTGRREALQQAWSAFTAASAGRWQAASLARARQLDFVMRTALYEGHRGRGCNAYGACERNVIALSIRNRALELCLDGQGCRSPGDFEGVSATVSQYNIWDEVLTQTTGLTSCFLRPDLADRPHYALTQRMYEQSVGDVERILYGRADELPAVFPGNSLDDLTRVRHYFHPPAMGKCFPNHERLEYISGAVARRGEDFALIANTRIAVGERRGSGYLFEQALVEDDGERDVVTQLDRYPGFVIDGRKVTLAVRFALLAVRNRAELPIRAGRSLSKDAGLVERGRAGAAQLPRPRERRKLPGEDHRRDDPGGRRLRQGDAAGRRRSLVRTGPRRWREVEHGRIYG